MHIVCVRVRVKPECVAAFREATRENARGSLEEPGVARFDVLQQSDDETHFMLIEVYREPEAANRHKETEHYRVWRDTVADMMAEPRSGLRYTGVFPDDPAWG